MCQANEEKNKHKMRLHHRDLAREAAEVAFLTRQRGLRVMVWDAGQRQETAGSFQQMAAQRGRDVQATATPGEREEETLNWPEKHQLTDLTQIQLSVISRRSQNRTESSSFKNAEFVPSRGLIGSAFHPAPFPVLTELNFQQSKSESEILVAQEKCESQECQMICPRYF